MIVRFDEFQARLERLHARGLIDQLPTRLQLFFGCLDMMRYYIVPGAADYYETRGINYRFHNLIKLLDDPASVLDPSGVRSPRDTIIGHVLHVVHANPIYDLQLLEMFEDGLDEMERQAQQLVDGVHPRQRSIGAVVEDPDYHDRLLAYIRAYRKDPSTPMLHRRDGGARDDPDFVLCEATFGTLDGAFRYFCRLPRSVRGLVEHYRTDRKINRRYCDPEIVAALERAEAEEAEEAEGA